MKKKVYAYLHTHWDREWYRDKEDFNLRFLEVFDVVLDELKHNRAPFFYLDGQIIALLDYLKYRKEKRDEIIDLIKNKKLAIGPYFVSADSYLANFHSMLKNLQIGMNYAKEFGERDFIGYLSDIFGISQSVFWALKLKNIDKALIWRGVNPQKINNSCDFLYNDIKTTWLAQGYFNDFFHQDKINIEQIKNYIDKIAKYSKNSLLLPIGADHLGILKNANKKIDEINKKSDDYEIILTSPFEYFKKTKYINKTSEKEFLDNSHTYILQGVYSARIAQKIKNNLIQNKISRIVEPFDFYTGQKYAKNIDFALETLIKNHAHDGIYGCSIDKVASAVDYRFEKCENIINAILKRLIGDFKKKYKIEGKSKDKLAIFNLSNFDNIKTIKIELPYILNHSQVISKKDYFSDEIYYDIYKIPVTEQICPIYTQLVEISNNKKFEINTVLIKKPKKTVKITEKSIENDYIKLQIKNKNVIISDKKQNHSFKLKLTDIKDNGDTYNFAPCGNYKTLDLIKTKVIYDGNIECCLELDYKNTAIRAYLDNHNKYLRFSANIKNKTKNHKLQLVCELDKNISKITSQDAAGLIERKIDYNYKMQDFMPAKRPYELKTNSYPIQNFVYTNNLGVLTKGLHEAEIYKNELKICLLRATGTISNPKNPARAIPAGPDLKTYKSQCLDEYECEFAFAFKKPDELFNTLDDFFGQYVAIDGDFTRNINIKFDKIDENYYIYGISEGKKIGYNKRTKEIKLL